jgi:hypothetical protein
VNYYLIECDNPDIYLRYYKNSRVGLFTRDQLNNEAGFHRYAIASDDEPIINVRVSGGFDVDHLAPAGQVIARLS